MKKYILLSLLCVLFSLGKLSAQSFSTQYDTVAVTASGYIDIYNNITNTTSDTISVTWKVINETLPQSWEDDAQFGICDNVVCYPKSILTGTIQTTDTISAGKLCLFKMQLDVSPASVVTTGATPYYVTTELTHGSTIDTVTFAINKWGTNIGKVNNTQDDVILYPNPAGKELNISYSADMNVKSIAVYNLVGKQMSGYRVGSNSARINIEKIPSGIYFVRLTDNTGRVVATRRFTHQ